MNRETVDDVFRHSHADSISAVTIRHSPAETIVPVSQLSREIRKLEIRMSCIAAIQLIDGNVISPELLNHRRDHRDAVLYLLGKSSDIILHQTGHPGCFLVSLTCGRTGSLSLSAA